MSIVQILSESSSYSLIHLGLQILDYLCQRKVKEKIHILKSAKGENSNPKSQCMLPVRLHSGLRIRCFRKDLSLKLCSVTFDDFNLLSSKGLPLKSSMSFVLALI